MARQERALATREAILQAAGVVFSNASYSTAKLSDITRDANITQGGLYFHFDSKQDLAQEVIKRQEEISRSSISEELARSGNRAAFALISSPFVFARDTMTQPIVRAGLRLNSESPEYFPEFAATPYLEWVATAEVLLHQGIEQGDVNPDADIPSIASIAVEAHTGTQLVSQVVSHWKDFGMRLERLYSTVLIPLMFLPERHPELREAQSAMRARILPSNLVAM